MWKIYLEIVKRPAGIEGFLLLAKGWIVERIDELGQRLRGIGLGRVDGLAHHFERALPSLPQSVAADETAKASKEDEVVA